MASDSEVMTSPTSLKPSYNVNDLKNILVITIKLNNMNYLLWVQSFIIFVISQKKKKKKKKKRIFNNSAAESDGYDDWATVEAYVMTWLINSMEEKISVRVIFLKIAKMICAHLKEMYSNKRNISRIIDLYKKMFSQIGGPPSQ